METPRGSRDTHTRWGPYGGGVVRGLVGGAQGAECLECEAGRGLLQDSPVKEGDGEEREEEGAERSIPIEGSG